MAPLWEIERKGAVLKGVGGQALLKAPLTAFFASRQCPGSAIRAAMGWALEQARARRAIISDFHSPLEQSVLQVLLQARSPAVAVLARPVAEAKLSPDWKAAILDGRMAVVSACCETKRLTSEQAMQRNELTAQLADAIFIAHASAGGELARQSSSWVGRGLQVLNLNLS
jgi:predicted Rossmann fold nucleotide-binding protein DprA/Smf involved in DNA uptake